MNTLQANFTQETTLLIQWTKGKVSIAGIVLDKNTESEFQKFVQSFKKLSDGVHDNPDTN